MVDCYKIKKGDSKELFLPENDFQTSSAVNFPKSIQISEAWKPTKHRKFRLEIFAYALTREFIYKNCFGHLIGTSGSTNPRKLVSFL